TALRITTNHRKLATKKFLFGIPPSPTAHSPQPTAHSPPLTSSCPLSLENDKNGSSATAPAAGILSLLNQPYPRSTAIVKRLIVFAADELSCGVLAKGAVEARYVVKNFYCFRCRSEKPRELNCDGIEPVPETRLFK
ncbi:hypothetical protein BC936DRAFT_142331, partial [Jimgerdemannia flammicorona]